MVGDAPQGPYFNRARHVTADEPLTTGEKNDYNRDTYIDALGGRLHYIPLTKMPETQFSVSALLKGDGVMPFSPVSDIVKKDTKWYSYEKKITDADRETLRDFPKQYVTGRIIQALIFGDTDFFSSTNKEKNTHRDTQASDFAFTYDFEQAYYGLGRPVNYAFESPEFRVWFMRRSRAECHATLTTLKRMHEFYKSEDGLGLIRGLEKPTNQTITQLFNFGSTGRIVETPEQFRDYLCDKIASAIGVVEYGPGVVLHFDPMQGRMPRH